MTENEKQKNYNAYIKAFAKCGVDASKLLEVYGEELKNATMSARADSGVAFDGSLINCVLNYLTPIACQIADMGKRAKNAEGEIITIPFFQGIDKNSIIKVCLLQHISKILQLEPNDVQWEIEKRGILYKYKDTNSMKTGLRSMWMATQCGIQFTEDEAEAICVIDNKLEDESVRYHASTLATIIMKANELMYTSFKNDMKQ